MPFIKLHTFQQVRHHPDTVLYQLREGQQPPDKYLPEIRVESTAIATMISVVTSYLQYPDDYVPAFYPKPASHPTPPWQLTTCTEITFKVRDSEAALTYRVEESIDEILALISEAEYDDKLRWHKQAKKARNTVGR